MRQQLGRLWRCLVTLEGPGSPIPMQAEGSILAGWIAAMHFFLGPRWHGFYIMIYIYILYIYMINYIYIYTIKNLAS